MFGLSTVVDWLLACLLACLRACVRACVRVCSRTCVLGWMGCLLLLVLLLLLSTGATTRGFGPINLFASYGLLLLKRAVVLMFPNAAHSLLHRTGRRTASLQAPLLGVSMFIIIGERQTWVVAFWFPFPHQGLHKIKIIRIRHTNKHAPLLVPLPRTGGGGGKGKRKQLAGAAESSELAGPGEVQGLREVGGQAEGDLRGHRGSAQQAQGHLREEAVPASELRGQAKEVVREGDGFSRLSKGSETLSAGRKAALTVALSPKGTQGQVARTSVSGA